MDKELYEKDIITEQDYTIHMAPTSTDPQNDSPGDSNADAGAEFMMGMNYEPKDVPIEEPEDVPVFDKKTQGLKELSDDETELSENVRVVSSEQPNPALDRDSASDTH